MKNPVRELPQGHPKPIGEERIPVGTTYHANWYQSVENFPDGGLWPNGVKIVHGQQGIIKHNEDLDAATNLISHRDLGADPEQNEHSGIVRLGIVAHIQTALQDAR